MAKHIEDRSPAAAVGAGKAIFAALTQQEIAGLLDVLFRLLPPDLNQQALEQLPPDTRHTLEQILSPPLAASKMTATADQPISFDST